MRLTVQVTLPACRSEVWAAVSTIGGLNREVGPVMRVTDPTGGAPFDAEPWRLGAPVTWQLLFGVIPVDRESSWWRCPVRMGCASVEPASPAHAFRFPNPR